MDDVDELPAINNYCELLPHQDKMITMATYIPQVIDQQLLHDMKSLSSQIQKIASSQVLHNLRDIITNEIMRLTKTCDDDHLPYLWDCLGVLYKVLAGKSVSLEDVQVMRNGIHPQSQDGQGLLNEIDDLQQDGTVLVGKEQSVLPERYIQVWVENMAMKIISQLKTSTHKIFFHMQLDQDTEGDANDYGFFCSRSKKLSEVLYLNNTTFSNAIQLVCKQKVSLMLKTLMSWWGQRGLLTASRVFSVKIDFPKNHTRMSYLWSVNFFFVPGQTRKPNQN